jgi:hypothetical protein
MFNIFTPLRNIHRPVRQIVEGFVAQSGIWAYLDTDGKLNNIPNDSSTQEQPKILKPVMTIVNDNDYECNDSKVMRVATLEGPFRASVDSNGFQLTDSSDIAIDYDDVDYLTVAFRIAPETTTDIRYSKAADIGKLRPASFGDIIVAKVLRSDSTTLWFETMSPRPFGGDDVWRAVGSGALTSSISDIDGTGLWEGDIHGSGDLDSIIPSVEGTGEQA